MSSIVKSTYECTAVVYNPMIPLNPQTNEAVFSTMIFVQFQARKCGMCCGTLTFDQPRYSKSFKIKQDNHPQFQHIFLRVGGFHQLMSFMGAGCKLMEDSGLDGLWATDYAKNSLPKVMEGKAHTKTLRACLLTNAALHIFLLQTAKCPIINSYYHSPSAPQETERIDVEADELSGSDDDHDETDELIIDRAFRNFSDMIDDGTRSHLQELYTSLYVSRDLDPDDVASDDTLQTFHAEICALKDKYNESRTPKLWIMFMSFVSVIRLLITAERTGNWSLHLKSTQEMLPYFAAAGHNNYAKCCRLYLQDCAQLCPCLQKPMDDGLFTIRRNKNLFWSGTWSDMTIEQCLMRAGKTQGGIINITMTMNMSRKINMLLQIETCRITLNLLVFPFELPRCKLKSPNIYKSSCNKIMFSSRS